MEKRAKVAGIVNHLFDAHFDPDLIEQERERAQQRAVVALAGTGVWLLQYLLGHRVQASTWFVVFLGLLGGVALIHRRALRAMPRAAIPLAYVFLVVDPLVIVGILVQDPDTFAFLYPVLIFVIVRCGLRYGVRTMYLALASAVAALPLLLGNPFFRDESASTASLDPHAHPRACLVRLVDPTHSQRQGHRSGARAR